jgi:nucleoside-diphosphate-sugar epimerase
MSPLKVLLIGGCGYIGSFLYPRLCEANHTVIVCDEQRRGNPTKIPVDFESYRNLPQDLLSDLDVVLWFGGHSSVGQSIEDPKGALANNCLDLYDFAIRLPEKVKLIYASTASLYSTRANTADLSDENSLIQIPEQNAYDTSKFAFDYFAKNQLKRFYGLRMGTLAGFSGNLRSELVFNAMNLAASENGVIYLKNSASMRTILYLKDLWILIKNLMDYGHQPGFYNAGSYTASMADLAIGIARTWGARIEYLGDSPTYSFALALTRMQAICGHELKPNSLEEACHQFIKDYHARSP